MNKGFFKNAPPRGIKTKMKDRKNEIEKDRKRKHETLTSFN